MKKYRLIKEYPGSPPKGEIISYEKETNISPDVKYYPEFWEEVIEKDYRILSWDIKYSDNKIREYHIHSVKRLSDGEVFMVGDSVKNHFVKGKIRKIILALNLSKDVVSSFSYEKYRNTIFLCVDNDHGNIPLGQAVKNKTKLFTTEDNVEIFEGDKYYSVHIKGLKIIENDDYQPKQGNIHDWKRFSSKKAAEEYILMNKPCLSIKDIAPIIGRVNEITYINLDALTIKLRELVKTKL